MQQDGYGKDTQDDTYGDIILLCLIGLSVSKKEDM